MDKGASGRWEAQVSRMMMNDPRSAVIVETEDSGASESPDGIHQGAGGAQKSDGVRTPDARRGEAVSISEPHLRVTPVRVGA